MDPVAKIAQLYNLTWTLRIQYDTVTLDFLNINCNIICFDAIWVLFVCILVVNVVAIICLCCLG